MTTTKGGSSPSTSLRPRIRARTANFESLARSWDCHEEVAGAPSPAMAGWWTDRAVSGGGVSAQRVRRLLTPIAVRPIGDDQDADRRSLVLAGGGMRVAYQAGVLAALEQAGSGFTTPTGRPAAP